MKKTASGVAALAAAGLLAFGGSSPAMAATCNDGDSRATETFVDENGDTRTRNTEQDYLARQAVPGRGETIVYGDGAESMLNPGYLGVTGDAGFVELSGNLDGDPNAQVDGQANGALDGRITVDGTASNLCVNGTNAP